MEKCPFCNQNIENEYNFCPYCGEALNDMAKKVEQDKDKKAQLKLITALANNVKDEQTLKLLSKITEKLS